jgi:hypothetical protein
MSVSPAQMQQLLAGYNPTPQQQQMQGLNAAQQSLAGGAPAGTNRTAGVANGISQLLVALMKAQKQKQLQQQLQGGQPAMPTPGQGVTPGGQIDTSSAPTGMMGPP